MFSLYRTVLQYQRWDSLLFFTKCEGRAKARIKYLQDAQKSFKRTIKAKNDMIEALKVALEDTRKLVSERNSEVRDLKRRMHELDQTVDSLISERDECASN